MSSIHIEKVSCPFCRHIQEFALRDFVDVEEDPALKQQLLGGALMRMDCSQCGAQTDVVFPLLYHDTEFRLLLWLIPGQGVPGDHEHKIGELDSALAATHQFRIVRTANELKEKIMIAEAGLDDRVVELFKAVIRRDPKSEIQSEDVVLFAGLEREEAENVLLFAVLRGKDRFEFPIAFDVFARFADEAESLAESLYAADGPWLTVDQPTTVARIRERRLE
jgi:hypothetical protein